MMRAKSLPLITQQPPHHSAIPLFLPRIAFVVIAADFPESRAILRQELDAVPPFGTLPELPVRNDDAHGPAMFAGQRFSFPAVRQQHVGLGEDVELHIGGVAVVGVENDVARFWLRPHELEDLPARHALPVIVVTAPGGDTVDVADEILLRQRHEFRQRPGERVLDEARHPETPVIRLHVRLDAKIEHRPVLHFLLAGWQAVGMAHIPLAGEEAPLFRPFLLGADELVLDAADEVRLVVLAHRLSLSTASAAPYRAPSRAPSRFAAYRGASCPWRCR